MPVTIIRKKKEDDGWCRSPHWPFPPEEHHVYNPQTEKCVRCSLPFDQWKNKYRPVFVLPEAMKKQKIKEDIGL
jgi:hypothetical protein